MYRPFQKIRDRNPNTICNPILWLVPERMKMIELSKFQICVNNCFKSTLNIEKHSLSEIHSDILSSKPRSSQQKCERNDWLKLV